MPMPARPADPSHQPVLSLSIKECTERSDVQGRRPNRLLGGWEAWGRRSCPRTARRLQRGTLDSTAAATPATVLVAACALLSAMHGSPSSRRPAARDHHLAPPSPTCPAPSRARASQRLAGPKQALAAAELQIHWRGVCNVLYRAPKVLVSVIRDQNMMCSNPHLSRAGNDRWDRKCTRSATIAARAGLAAGTASPTTVAARVQLEPALAWCVMATSSIWPAPGSHT